MRIRSFLAAAFLALTFTSSALAQQASWPRRAIGIQGGVLYHDMYGDRAAPHVIGRLDWRTARWVLVGLSAFYAQPDDPGSDPTHMFGSELLVQAEAPLQYLRPFVGMGFGVHGTFEPEGGDRFFAPSTQVLAGIRTLLHERWGAIVEARYRIDQQQSTPDAADNIALTAGITWSLDARRRTHVIRTRGRR
jgi:hypothetical protein